jgi:hypothetical protein
MDALLLAELAQDNRDETLAVGRDIGWRRVLGVSQFIPGEFIPGECLRKLLSTN